MLSLIYPQINHEIDKENNFYDREYSSHIVAFVPNNNVCVPSHNFIYSRHTCDSSMVVASCSNIELCIKKLEMNKTFTNSLFQIQCLLNMRIRLLTNI